MKHTSQTTFLLQVRETLDTTIPLLTCHLHPEAHGSVVATYEEVTTLMHSLITDVDGEDLSRVDTAKHLLRITETADGRDTITTAVVSAGAVPQLVNYLRHPGDLRKHIVGILACILQARQTWDVALETGAIAFLVASLSDPNLDTQVAATHALKGITGARAGKEEAVKKGAVPVLVMALSHPSYKMKRWAVQAVRNITSIDCGSKAAYAANAIYPLLVLLDATPPFDVEVMLNAAIALTCIAFLSKDVRTEIKKQDAFQKVRAIRGAGEIQTALDNLVDMVKRGRPV